MTWFLKHKALVIGAAVLWLIWRETRKQAGGSDQTTLPIGGRIDSGSQWGLFDVNPDSPTFGDPWFGPLEE